MRLLVLAVVVCVSCVTFRPVSLSLAGAIRPLSGAAGGSCTAWAVGPAKWITAAHCREGVDTLDGVRIEWLAVDVAADIALLRGPESARTFHLAERAPAFGDPLHVYGYGMGHQTLLVLPGVFIAADSDFFKGSPGMLIGIANGMPGMSGGPILWRGRVVSLITGGGAPASLAHTIGTGVPWATLSAFVERTKAAKS